MRHPLRHATAALLAAVALILINPWADDVRADRKDNKQALKQTMRRWAKELGVKCGYCHVQEGRKFDYEAPTHHKAVSLVCADEFVEKLRTETEQRLSCASCHVDKAHHVLPRPGEDEARDEAQVQAAVSTYCQETFVAKLKTADGEAVSCATCHVDQEQPAKFLPETSEEDQPTTPSKDGGEDRD